MDIERLLSKLSAKQAEAIRATRLDGLSVAEAAKSTGIGGSDMRVSTHSGLKALARLLRRSIKGLNMDTDRLIDSLCRDIRPMSRHVVGQRIAMGVVGGCLITVGLVATLLGLRADLAAAVRSFSFWMKWTYTLSLAVVAITATAHLARPTGVSFWSLWVLAIPVLLLGGIGIGELASTPVPQWLAMWLGNSWRVCPWLVLMLSLPIFAGLLWSFRTMAPVRLRATGATVGLAAGAWAAAIYCLHCPEVSALFVLTWYSLGIALAAAIGALLGPTLLRW